LLHFSHSHHRSIVQRYPPSLPPRRSSDLLAFSTEDLHGNQDRRHNSSDHDGRLLSPPAVVHPAAPRPRYPRRLQGSQARRGVRRSEEHTSEHQSRENLVCRLLLEKKKKKN